MAYFNDLNHLVAEYDFDAEMQLYKIKKYLSKHNAAMEYTVFKTDQYEGRLAYLDREIEILEHLIEKSRAIDFTYEKRIQVDG